MAIGLRAATGIVGIQESSTRALAKLEQVLPSRLRPMVTAIGAVVDRAPENVGTDAPDPEVDPAVLAAIAAAIRDEEWLRFDDRGTPRLVEPYRLLSWQRRWYLVGRDPQSGEWGVFRADWMQPRMPTRRRFVPQPGARRRLHRVRDALDRDERMERARAPPRGRPRRRRDRTHQPDSASWRRSAGRCSSRPGSAAIAALTNATNRARYYSLLGVVGGLGMTLGPLIGALLLRTGFLGGRAGVGQLLRGHIRC